jgi:DNA helicase-2/ATP-dependent DNA helicase PcrA
MSIYEEALQQLNLEQKEAVNMLLGPVMVVAGPGSGKTQLLSLRVAHILQSQDIHAENILCLTFTDAAAHNMRQRLASFIGNKAYNVHIHTFHGFGQSLLKDYPEYTAGIEKTAIESVYQAEIINSIIQVLPYNHILIPRGEDRSSLIKNIASAINYIKQAGLTPSEYQAILQENKAQYELLIPIIHQINDISIIGKKDRQEKLQQFRILVESIPEFQTDRYFESYSQSLKKSLLLAIEETESLEKETFTPISQWKSKHLIKGKDGKKILIDYERYEKQMALGAIYQQYQEYLQQNQLLDFSDMLLNALTLLKENESLRAKLQEQYQFILVDEFQDTNEVQMQLILSLIGDNPEPNILVVGDDDQGIYGFQGADISHMFFFQHKFPTTQLMVLTQNYRSRKEILDIARQVIIQGKNRLETRIEVLEKRLESAKLRQEGDLAYYEFTSQAEEYTYIANKIEELRKSQVDLSEIAIIARQHTFLEEIVPFLAELDIPLEYEKQYNLLNETIIHQLITLLRFIYSLTPSQSPRNDLLPEILSYSFWGINTLTVWKFFQERDYTKSYIERLYSSANKDLRAIGELCLHLAVISEYETIEYIILYLMGSIEDSNRDNSQFYQYYLGKTVFEKRENEYIENLAKIKSFIEHIISYKQGQRLTLKDGLDTIKAYQNQGGMQVKSTINTGKQSIKLMTAHKSKGLEFETVFIIGAHSKGWASKGKSSPYPFPLNLPIVPKQDSEDDFLRILFVALTRSKNNLFITSHKYNDDGKEHISLPYLSFLEKGMPPQVQSLDIANSQLRAIQPNIFHSQEVSFLEGVIQQYRFSASHLNNFVDTVYKGPLTVLESALLHFPSIATIATAYGNISHRIFHYISLQIQSGKDFPDNIELIQIATKYLSQERLNRDDTEKLSQRIQDQLPVLIQAKKESFFVPHESEYNVRELYLEWEGTPLTGSIDRIEEYEDYYVIVDFKTGSPILSWDNKPKKALLDKYKRQLWFYAFLLKVAGKYQDKPLQGRIDFLEPTIEGEFISLSIPIEQSDIDYISQLTQIIYHKIISLDFPDISIYAQNQEGVEQFIQDLLENNV